MVDVSGQISNRFLGIPADLYQIFCLYQTKCNGFELSGQGIPDRYLISLPPHHATLLSNPAASPVRSSEWLARLPHLDQITLTLCVLDVWVFGYYSSKLLVQSDISPTNDNAHGEAGRVNWKYPKPTARTK